MSIHKGNFETFIRLCVTADHSILFFLCIKRKVYFCYCSVWFLEVLPSSGENLCSPRLTLQTEYSNRIM